MAPKLDMSKSYYRVEWDYIACVLINMGFPAIWIDRVMKCVTTASYSFSVHGEASEVVIPKRGLRQGDPLSPYLFLLCAEGFGALIKRAHQNNLMHGISIARGAPFITHLCFADDSLEFARADESEARVILGILKDYEALSGQMVNFDKCEISFNKSLFTKLARSWVLR